MRTSVKRCGRLFAGATLLAVMILGVQRAHAAPRCESCSDVFTACMADCNGEDGCEEVCCDLARRCLARCVAQRATPVSGGERRMCQVPPVAAAPAARGAVPITPAPIGN